MTKIGFVGLGRMGTPMVGHLLAAGYQVLVYDIRKEALNASLAAGATAADSLKDLAEQSDVVFTMVQTGEQVNDVCLSETGLFNYMRQDALFIDSSSIDVTTCRHIHAEAKQRGITMVDAPVSGGVAGAKAASLTVMVGGDDDAFARAEPILQKLGKHIIHTGLAGNGQAAKICNNMILGISMIAISEAFTLAENLGLPAKTLFEVSSKSSGRCWAMTEYSPVPGLIEQAPSNNDYQPGFTANMMLKDLKLSQAAAASAGTATPLGAEATSLYTLFCNQGDGELDFSGIIKMIGLSTLKGR